jgi:hypothetical protein
MDGSHNEKRNLDEKGEKMKCSKCKKNATGLVTTAVHNHNFEILIQEFRCLDHLNIEIEDIEIKR